MADDYGIGPNTSQGIRDLAARGLVTGAVLLVNSPFAEESVRAWKQSTVPLELGWHACLTLDRPILPAAVVPSLVQPDGMFWPLGTFLRRLLMGQARPDQIAAEFKAQYERFRDLTGNWPTFVNGHHHVQCFAPIGSLLVELLAPQRPLPYLRRVREPWRMMRDIPGARLKRTILSALGRRIARKQETIGFPGNIWFAGITNPDCVDDPDYLVRWVSRIPGAVVELACHPGYQDDTLIGRDGKEGDGLITRRLREWELLADPRFSEAVRHAGFALTAPSQLAYSRAGRSGYAA
jgi:predicted glycoside hydrolase/deacetylase ChbG (UPF0249 family)